MEEEKVRKEEAHAENYHPKLIPLSLALAHTAHIHKAHTQNTLTTTHKSRHGKMQAGGN